uniref:Uncharacterized protein n=1 Tax=viral metagenome TaxID=1070528 RepID=A0A6C0J6P1_9ZZZZ
MSNQKRFNNKDKMSINDFSSRTYTKPVEKDVSVPHKLGLRSRMANNRPSSYARPSNDRQRNDRQRHKTQRTNTFFSKNMTNTIEKSEVVVPDTSDTSLFPAIGSSDKITNEQSNMTNVGVWADGINTIIAAKDLPIPKIVKTYKKRDIYSDDEYNYDEDGDGYEDYEVYESHNDVPGEGAEKQVIDDIDDEWSEL